MDSTPIEKLAAHSESISKFDGYRGNVIGLWACIESAMDRANHYAWWYSDKEVADKVPVSLGRKIRLFKEVNRDLTPFEPLKDQADRLSWAVESLYEDRHWLAHGYLNFNNVEDGKWVVEKHEFPKDTGGMITASKTFSEEDLQVLRLKLMALAREFAGYLRALAAQVEKHSGNDQTR